MRKHIFFASTALLTGGGLLACALENALVGNECLPGYAPSGDRCIPASVASHDAHVHDGAVTDATSDAPTTEGDGSASDSGGGGDGGEDADAGVGLVCTPPLVACNGVCVDITSDPLNCGACNNICPSLLCSNSKCQGTVAGHIVVYGHDYQGTFSGAQRKALENAALLARPATIRVRSYEQYANPTAVAQVKNVITTAAQAQGRSTAYAVAMQPTDVSGSMTALNTDILVVYDQVNAPAGALATIGAGWASTLSTFASTGGIVIVLDGAGGTNPQMPAFMTSSLLLDVSSDTKVTVGTPLLDVASQDAVGQGLVSPYGAGRNTVHFACNETNGGAVTYVVVDPAETGASPPVIVHKVAQ